MAGFLDVDDLTAYIGAENVDQGDYGNLVLAIDAACDLVRQHLCQTIDVVLNDVVTLHGTDTRALLLPELPVVSVDSITLDGVAVTDYTLDTSGLLWRDDPGWWARGEKYVVTYDHGFVVVPADIKLVTLRLARDLFNELDAGGTIASESVAGYSVTYRDTGASGMTGAGAVLATLDRRIVKKVPIP